MDGVAVGGSMVDCSIIESSHCFFVGMEGVLRPAVTKGKHVSGSKWTEGHVDVVGWTH